MTIGERETQRIVPTGIVLPDFRSMLEAVPTMDSVEDSIGVSAEAGMNAQMRMNRNIVGLQEVNTELRQKDIKITQLEGALDSEHLSLVGLLTELGTLRQRRHRLKFDLIINKVNQDEMTEELEALKPTIAANDALVKAKHIADKGEQRRAACYRVGYEDDGVTLITTETIYQHEERLGHSLLLGLNEQAVITEELSVIGFTITKITHAISLQQKTVNDIDKKLKPLYDRRTELTERRSELMEWFARVNSDDEAESDKQED